MVMKVTFLEVAQLTLSVAVILASASIWIFKGASDGFVFLLLGALFTIVLRFIEQGIYEDNFNHGRLEFQN